MNEVNNIQEELNSMGSPLAGMPKDMPYTVPAGYFEQLANTMAATAMQHEDKVPDFGRQLPYKAPAGYFDALPEKMLQVAKAKEQEGSGDKGKTAKTIGFIPGVRWAAAAALVIIIGAGGFMMFTGSGKTGAEQMLASIPQHEIKAYVQQRYGIDPGTVESSVNIKNLDVDSKDIVAYLDETGWD